MNTMMIMALVNNRERCLLVRQFPASLEENARSIVEEMMTSVIHTLYENPRVMSSVIKMKDARKSLLLAAFDNADSFASVRADVEYQYGKTQYKTSVSIWFYNCGKLDVDKTILLP